MNDTLRELEYWDRREHLEELPYIPTYEGPPPPTARIYWYKENPTMSIDLTDKQIALLPLKFISRRWGIRHLRWIVMRAVCGEVSPNVLDVDMERILQRVWMRERLDDIWEGRA